MHVVRALVGVDHLEVDHVADHAVFVRDAVAAQHVARHPRDVQRFAAGVAFHDRSDFDRRGAGVLHPAQLQTALQAERDLGLHVGQLLLDQLVGGQRPAKLLAVQHILAGAVEAVLGSAQRAPSDAVARAVQAGERAFQAAHVGESVFLGAEHPVHHDLAGDRRTQTHFAVDRRRAQARSTLVQDEAADRAFVVLGPHQKYIGDRRVADPHLGARQAVAAGHLLRAGDHAAGVRAVVGLGQAEAADPLAARQLGQVFLLLRLGAELIDRHHHQRGLHAHHRAVARIDPLDFARHQAVADVVQARAAVGFGDRRPQQPQLAHLVEDRTVGLLVPESLQHPRRQPLLAVAVGGVAHRALVVAELGVELQRVVPDEFGVAGHGGCPVSGLRGWQRWPRATRARQRCRA